MEHARYFATPPEEARALDLIPFLQWVGRPALFRLKGGDSTRARLICGGLHGNEPSGFRAIHDLLREPPADLPCDVLLLLGNSPAALTEPRFSHRAVPGEEDMNRVWDRPGTPQRALAAELLAALHEQPLEAVADLHNNTGFNPIYAVVIGDRPEQRALARCWTHRTVRYGGQLLGTLLEQLDPPATGVVIECGQAGDPEADRRAIEGARRFVTAPDPFALEAPGGAAEERFRSVGRITVPPGLRIDFAERPTEADLTVFPGIDRYNFRSVAVGTLLGYTSSPEGRLVVTGNDGRDATSEFLAHREGRIYLLKKIVPVMMTTNAEVATSDCLLYAAERVAEG